jgi:hypothetical protein
MLARPAAIAAVPFADRFASGVVYGNAAARIIPRCALGCERFACGFDCTEAMLAPRFRHARLAMPTPTL